MEKHSSLSNPKTYPSLEVFDARPLKLQDFYAWAQSLDVGSEQTIETYSKNIRRFVEYLQDNGITKPTRNDILDYRNWLKETKKQATIHGYMVALKLFFRWTEDQGIYPNIAKYVKSPSVGFEHRRDPLTVNQIKDILDSIDCSTTGGMRDFALILLMVTTGLREISVASANVDDIVMRAFDDDSTKDTEYKPFLYYKSKGHAEKDLFVILPAITKHMIDAYLSMRRADGNMICAGSPLFASLSNNNNNGRLTTRSIRRIITTRFQDAELDLSRISTHSLRHSFATINLLSGGSLEETQKALGHRNIETTMIYSHAIIDESNPSTARVADVLFSSPDSKN